MGSPILFVSIQVADKDIFLLAVDLYVQENTSEYKGLMTSYADLKEWH